MRPLRLTLNNFLSYRGEHTVDLEGVSLAVLSGPNGSGKSSLIDATGFALFVHARGGLDSVITEGEEACRVEFVFALADETYLVSRQRSRKGNGSTLLSLQSVNNGTPVVLDGKTVAETQRRIQETLRLTDDLLTVTAFCSQGQSAAFSQAKPAARKQVLSDILDLAAWERRAEMARQMGRDLATSVETMKQQAERAKARAEEADGLREQIAQLDADLEAAEAKVKAKETELAESQEAKENLVRDREADRAQRRELDGLTERVQQAQINADTLASRLEGLQGSVKGKSRITKELQLAEQSQTYAQELEAKRQEHERLGHEAELASQRQRAAVTEHGGAVKALTDRIAQATASHERQVASLRQRITDLTAQAEPLARVPCAGTDLEAECPLIAAARKAKAALPDVEQELAQTLEADPTAEDRQELASLEAAEPGTQEAARLQEIARERRELAYDAKAHTDAKRQARKVQELQQDLTRIETAQVQMAEVQTSLDAARAEASELAERKQALEQELGPKRNWEAMLRQVERTITDARAAIETLQSRVRPLGQQRGSLEERLRGAEQAAQEAERLAGELRQDERRLKVLKVLAQAFGKAGIPALLIEQAVPDLEDVANDVLSVLSDGRMSLELRSQRETKAKTIQETLDIIVADEHGPRAYENFSGGEAMRVDLALRIALSVLLASRAGARCELLVLDEAAAPLDAQGQALFAECLQKVADRFATILVVSHVEALKELFPYRFEVSKTAEGSRVDVIAA